MTEIQRARLRQRYAHLGGRSVEFGFTSLGLTVKAASPDELGANTAEAIVAATKGEREN